MARREETEFHEVREEFHLYETQLAQLHNSSLDNYIMKLYNWPKTYSR